MRPGRFAAEDGSLARSAGAQAGRGLLLLALAVIIGIVLLNATQSEPPGTTISSNSIRPATGRSGATTTTTVNVTTTTVALRAPRDVKVVVANASGTKGAASKVGELLKPPGYNVLAPTNATPNVKDSAIYFEKGFDREAAGVAQVLQLPASALKPMPTPPPIPVADLKGANVLVIVGSDLSTRVVGVTATTTTAKPATASSTTVKAVTTSTAPPATTTTTKKP